MPEIIFFLAGAFVSWLITLFYYKKTDRDSKEEFRKVHEEFFKKAAEKIKEEFGNKAKVSEILSDLWTDISKKHGKQFLENRCPRCGSNDFETAWVTYDEDEEIGITFCQNCSYELD